MSRVFALVLSALVASGCASSAPKPSRTPTPAPATQTNRPPSIISLTASESPTDQTTYVVTAVDIDGDRLFFRWTNTNTCGKFEWTQESNVAVWTHKRPPCPDDPVQKATITVEVADGRGGSARIEYPNGSASGIVTH